MKLIDVIHRDPIPEPWVEGEKIPWNDPDFSRRMLKEHLTQAHDLASRRFEVIDRQVEWLHQKILSGLPCQILDLGCGPGFYTSRLARLGHRCTGLDFSPASIAYAQQTAQAEQLECRYLQADITTADYGAGYDLAMLIFGEFNVFRPATARLILSKAYQALKDGGTLLLEPHTFEAIQRVEALCQYRRRVNLKDFSKLTGPHSTDF
jgi:2-polyprenyl-3-methyl-5-hydroxy-6-metoxy-1,4-benzoquinol methylase